MSPTIIKCSLFTLACLFVTDWWRDRRDQPTDAENANYFHGPRSVDDTNISHVPVCKYPSPPSARNKDQKLVNHF